jgi:hypothetical protein
MNLSTSIKSALHPGLGISPEPSHLLQGSQLSSIEESNSYSSSYCSQILPAPSQFGQTIFSASPDMFDPRAMYKHLGTV